MPGTKLTELLQLPCYVFDMDGVVVDSSAAHESAFRETFSALDIPFPDYTRFAGRATAEVIQAVLGENRRQLESNHISELIVNKQRRAMEMIGRGEGIAALPGVLDYIAAAKDAGKQLLLVTSASRERALLVIKLLGLEGIFEVVITSDEATSGKPSPEPYLAALRALGNADAAECLVHEDSSSGLESALGAGMNVIFFNPDGQRDDRAHYSADSFKHLRSELIRVHSGEQDD